MKETSSFDMDALLFYETKVYVTFNCADLIWQFWIHLV